MKQTLFIGFTLLLLQQGSTQTWTSLSVGAASEVMYLSFPTNDTGYVSLDNGTLRKTTNGALNWTQCPIITTVTSDIEFVTGTRGFMFASNGVVMTTDGAQSWNYVITNSTLMFYDICFATNTVGYASATNANIDTVFVYKTTDGGANWNLTPALTGPFNAFYPLMYFTSADTGFISAESYTLKTVNGGLTWTQVYQDPNFDIFSSMYSPDGVNIFAGYFTTDFGSSNDGGDNWTQSSTNTNYPGYGVYFTNATHGYYCGGNGLGSGAIEETNNGGASWTPVHTGNSFWCMDFPSVGTGYVGGTNGVIVKYSASTSVSESSPQTVSCYPNPATDFLTIENISSGSGITITNSLGEIVFEQTAIDNRMRIDVSDLAAGVYSCQIISKRTRSTEQLIIQ